MGGGSNLAMSSLSLPPGHDDDDDGDDGDGDGDDDYHNGGHCGVTFVVQRTLRVSMIKILIMAMDTHWSHQ